MSAGHFRVAFLMHSLLTHIRTSVPLARHFMLIPVAFEIAYSLLHTLRGRRPVCVFEELFSYDTV